MEIIKTLWFRVSHFTLDPGPGNHRETKQRVITLNQIQLVALLRLSLML